jgi:hypothetical protein
MNILRIGGREGSKNINYKTHTDEQEDPRQDGKIGFK